MLESCGIRICFLFLKNVLFNKENKEYVKKNICLFIIFENYFFFLKKKNKTNKENMFGFLFVLC